MPAERTPIRRQPPPFRSAVVTACERVTPRLTRIRVTGSEFAALTLDEPAASVRLLIPTPGDDQLIVPDWNGNEFLRPDGSRPIIRTLTPRHLDGDTLTLEIVLHADGAMSDWAGSVTGGEDVAVSGMGRGYAIDETAHGFLLAGDESAMPAIAQLLEWIPPDAEVRAIIEIGAPEGRARLPSHRRATVEWVELPEGASPGDSLVAAVGATDIPDAWRVWAAGEAASMFQIRKHLFDTVGLERRHATVRGYWKHGRSGPGSD